MAAKISIKTKQKAGKLKGKTESEVKKDKATMQAEEVVLANFDELLRIQELEDELATLKEVKNTVVKTVTEVMADKPPGKLEVETSKGTVTFKALSNSTQPSVETEELVKAFEDVQEGLSGELAKFSVTDARQYLPKTVFDKMFSTSKSGNRNIQNVKKK